MRKYLIYGDRQQMQEMKPIYWAALKVRGNRYMQPLHPDMLKPEGFKVPKSRNTKAGIRFYEVHYDVSYVFHKMCRDFLIPLGIDEDELHIFVSRYSGQIGITLNAILETKNEEEDEATTPEE